jgi:hypothetical protein
MGEQPSKTGVRFFDWLFHTDGHPVLYVLKVWPVHTIPAMLIAIVIYSVAWLAGYQELFAQPPVPSRSLALDLWSAVIVGPTVETLLMVVIFRVLKRQTNKKLALVFRSALIWALVHSLAVPLWGLFVLWGFIVLSSAFLAWSEKSPKMAFWVTFALHALHNLTLVVLGAVNDWCKS